MEAMTSVKKEHLIEYIGTSRLKEMSKENITLPGY